MGAKMENIQRRLQNTVRVLMENDSSYYTEFDGFIYRVCCLTFTYLPSKFKLTEYPKYGKRRDPAAPNSGGYIDLSVEEQERWKNMIPENTYWNCKQTLELRGETFIERRCDEGAFLITESEVCIAYIYDDIYVYCDGLEIPEWVRECVVFPEENEFSYHYLVYDTDSGFTMFPMKIGRQEIDLETNYNSDLPDEQIKDFLESDESGLVILHGLAGTGKTTYIRHLITSVERRFVYVDQLAFSNISDISFIRLMSRYSNSVIIVEDCEVLLAERESGNASISSLLNLTDGILGDTFKFKIICTFNSDLTRLDKALLRKGRLKVKYDFRHLEPEKVGRLAEKLGVAVDEKDGKRLTLSEVYNYKQKVDFAAKKEKHIGF